MFNPCGMVWTYLRSCYTFTMRLFIGGREQEFPARWYFCADGALPFPGLHGAEASPWLKTSLGEVNAAWGEVTPFPTDPGGLAGRGLDRGLNPGYRGKCFIGDPQWFVDGNLPSSVLTSPPPPLAGCCQAIPQVSTGGIILAGFSSALHAVAGCPQCPAGAPATWLLTVSGGTGVFAVFNGTHRLPNVGGCVWALVIATDHWILKYDASIPGWLVQLAHGTIFNSASYGPMGSFQCLGSTRWRLTGSGGAGTPPNSVTSSPG